MTLTTERREPDRGLKRWKEYVYVFVTIIGIIYGVASWLMVKLYATPLQTEARIAAVESKIPVIDTTEKRVTVLETKFNDTNEAIFREIHAINRKLDR